MKENFISDELERRHSKWYESFLLSSLSQFFIGLFIIVFLSALVRWGWGFWFEIDQVRVNTLVSNFISFFVVFVLDKRFRRYPGTQPLLYVAPTILIVYLAAFTILFFLRADYSRLVLFFSLIISLTCFFTGHFLRMKIRRLKLAVVPFGMKFNAEGDFNVDVYDLSEPSFNGQRFDAVVADLHSDELTPEWEAFLARCTLAHVPVYHVKQIRETLTGRVRIEHLSENEFGSLLPDENYVFLKRLFETVAIFMTIPLWLPVMLITGLAIKVESSGAMFFTQERVGQGGKPFKVYKLRSMCKDSEASGAQFAQDNDMRVTRIGRFIRKTRIDEIPQFINVLKGEMSIIGPRPEQKVFVDKFEQEIPFYAYRHVVKPGITGWAQVVHGYAADTDDTRVKIEHDFYYIKHFSFWLDLLVVYKTLQTIFTGFGAR